MIDTHCHLSDPRFGDISEVIERAIGNGVKRMILPATDLKDSQKISQIIEDHQELYGAVGVYPGNVEDLGINDEELCEKLRVLIDQNKKIVAIGEIGMDGYWNKRNLGKQRRVFASQMRLAVDLKLPAVIHSRAAELEIKSVLEEMEELPSGQFHCYGGDEEFLKYILKRGFYVSFCGNVTYKSADHLRQLAKITPLERLLLETDSPYLSPEGKRGERNEPGNVRMIADFLANLLGVDLPTLIYQTDQNAECLYFAN